MDNITITVQLAQLLIVAFTAGKVLKDIEWIKLKLSDHERFQDRVEQFLFRGPQERTRRTDGLLGLN